MFGDFLSVFLRDPGVEPQANSFASPSWRVEGLTMFLHEYGAASFNRGLYRVHLPSAIPRWNETVGEAFPDFRKRIWCFASDWLGRQFALDGARIQDGEPLVLLLEPGTGSCLEVPANFVAFHDGILVQETDAALASTFQTQWLASGGAPPSISECVGYKVPLFLGGQDVVSNLELIDMEVYWVTHSQLLQKTRGLPPGTRIGNVSIGDA